MIYDILPIILIIVSLAGVVYILIKKLPEVAAVDVNKIPEEVQNEVKKNLLEKRVNRKLGDMTNRIKPFGRLIGRGTKSLSEGFKNKIASLENKYREKSREVTKEVPENLKDKVDKLFAEAKDLTVRGELESAEKKYLEIIGLDSYNILAYAALGEIYYKKKELEGAKESMEYVVKLARNGYGQLEASDYILLTLVYQDLNDFRGAYRSVKRAVRIEPKNPRNLDLLCKISIIIKNKEAAIKACEALAEVDPNNEKIKQFRAEIVGL